MMDWLSVGTDGAMSGDRGQDSVVGVVSVGCAQEVGDRGSNGVWVFVECRGSDVECQMSRVEGKKSRVKS